MKQFLFLLIALPFAKASIAQSTYESPHVKDGKTIQLTIPAGYFEVIDIGSGGAVYSTDENVDIDVKDIGSIEVGIITLMHLEREDETLQSLKEDLEEKTEADKDEIIILAAPEIIEVNGRKCLFAGFDGDIIDEGVDRMYFSVIEFGDYFILVNYFASDQLKEQLDYEEFKEIMASWKEIATTKKDGINIFEVEGEENEVGLSEEDFESDYKNDFFETNLTYLDILPDFVGDWDEPYEENSHLLSEFYYKEKNGRVIVFSAGFSSKNLNEEGMADAIQLVTGWSDKLIVEFDSQFANEDHVFKLYSISGGGTMTSVYTTSANDELVFFVVDGGSNPVDDFKPAVRDFMLTMWVDSFDEEAE